MSSVREAIRQQSRFARMRLGQQAFEYIVIPSMPDIRAAQVPLNEAETQLGLVAAASVDVPDNDAGMHLRNRAAMVSDAFHSLREPDDLAVKVFASIEDMVEQLEPTDIDVISDSLTILMEYASPSIDGLTEEVLEELKKDFGATDWSALTGRRWAAVKLCLQVLLPELLQVRLHGSTSTESLTTRSESDAST